MAYPVLGQQFILDTDASDSSVGAVLSEVQDDRERVIAYMSKAINIHERSYCVTRKELLAVIVAIQNFHTYLYGKNAFLRKYNVSMSWMKSLRRSTGQVARWLQELCTYNLTVCHRPGKRHTNADALSRTPCKACKRQQDITNSYMEESNENQEVALFNEDYCGPELIRTHAVTRQQDTENFVHSPVLLDGRTQVEIRQSQIEDEDIGQILVLRLSEEKQPRPEWSAISKKSAFFKTLWRNWDRPQLNATLLYRSWKN